MRVSSLRRLANLVGIVIVGAILVGTLSPPGSPTATTFGLNPSFGHLGLFGALGVASALRYAVSERARRLPRNTLALVFFGFWLLAAGTELLQGFVGRDPSFADWLVDMIGAAIGFFGGATVLRLFLPRVIVAPAHEEAAATDGAPTGRARSRRRRTRAR